jgi:hypothetical protein
LSHAAISTGCFCSHAVIESVSLDSILSFMHPQYAATTSDRRALALVVADAFLDPGGVVGIRAG